MNSTVEPIFNEKIDKNGEQPYHVISNSITRKILSPFGYSWKLKTEKHCSKIIFKCVNSVMRPNFNLTFTKIRTYGHVNNAQDPHKKG